MEARFSDVLDAVETLSIEDKEMLIDIVRKRMVEERRAEMRRSIAEAEAEFKAGLCKPMSVDEIMAEIRS